MNQEIYTKLQKKTYRNNPGYRGNPKKDKNFQKYLKSWQDEIIRPLEKKLNVTVSGYDPSISFYCNTETPFVATAQIPLWVAEKILGIRE